MMNTTGPEIRSGFFEDDVETISLKKGESLTFTSDYTFKGNAQKLACSYPSLAASVQPGQTILISDGNIALTIQSCNIPEGEVTCLVENDGTVGQRTKMHLPGIHVDLPTLSQQDIQDLQEWAVPNDVDFVAVSYVRKASDVHDVRTALGEKGQGIKIIARIENIEGLQYYHEILQVADGIMIARGNLGTEIPSEKVFLAQKMMIRDAHLAGKPIITATQMLESMLCNPRPTRAECSDVANAVIDGTDCVMLSGETAAGPYYEEAVFFMARTCCEAESIVNHNNLYQAVRTSSLVRYGRMSTHESVASSAVKTAIDIKAKLIVVLSDSGNTVRLVAKYRPGVPILVLTPFVRVARQVNGMFKGCTAIVVESTGHIKEFHDEMTAVAKQVTGCKDGDLFVLVRGNVFGYTDTNQIKVLHISSAYKEDTCAFGHEVDDNTEVAQD